MVSHRLAVKQGLLPFQFEAAPRPMDLTAHAGLTLDAETLLVLGVSALARRTPRGSLDSIVPRPAADRPPTEIARPSSRCPPRPPIQPANRAGLPAYDALAEAVKGPLRISLVFPVPHSLGSCACEELPRSVTGLAL